MINYQLWDLIGPSTWPLWLLVLAAAQFVGRDLPGGARTRRGRALTFAALALALLFSATPFGSWLIEPLEQRFPPSPLGQAPKTVLVLGGAERLAASEWRGALEMNEAGERVLEGAALAHRFPTAKVAIAGGVRLVGSPLSDVGLVKDAWTRLGVEPARIVVVDHTADTCANALGSTKLERPILLVTSAFHMPRAVACFRAVGIEPLIYPVDFRAVRPGRSIGGVLGNLSLVDFALHEWVGLAWYRLRGRTHELYPAPNP